MKKRNNQLDFIYLITAMVALMVIAVVLKSKTISIPVELIDDTPAMSPTGTMSGTIG